MEPLFAAQGPLTQKVLRRNRNLIRVLSLALTIVLITGGTFRLIVRTEQAGAIAYIVLGLIITPTIFTLLHRRRETKELSLLSFIILVFGASVLTVSVVFTFIHLGNLEWLRVVFDILWGVLVAALSVGIFYFSFRYKRSIQSERNKDIDDEIDAEADLTEQAIKPILEES